MTAKFRDFNVVSPPKNKRYIPVLKYTYSKDADGTQNYTVENKAVIPKEITVKDNEPYGSIILSDKTTKLFYYYNEIAGAITYVLLSNGELYSDAWLINHIDYIENNLLDSSNNPLTIIKNFTSDADIAKVKELVKKLDFDHFLNISYDNESKSVTLDMDNVTSYQDEDKAQPQKDNNGNWYLPKTNNAYGELGIGYAQPCTYDSTTGHNTILTPGFETATDEFTGNKFVRAKKPTEVYPNAVSGDIYPIFPASKIYSGNNFPFYLAPLPYTINVVTTIKPTIPIKRWDDSNVDHSKNTKFILANIGDLNNKNYEDKIDEANEKSKTALHDALLKFNSTDGRVIINNMNDKSNISDLSANDTIMVCYSKEIYSEEYINNLSNSNPIFDIKEKIDTYIQFQGTEYYTDNNGKKWSTTFNCYYDKENKAYKYTLTDVYVVTFSLKENIKKILNTKQEVVDYRKKIAPIDDKSIYSSTVKVEKFNYSSDYSKVIAWHMIMSYDGSVWTPKDFMSSITKTYTLVNDAATEKTDGTGTFYKFDDTMYPFSNSDIADIVCGKNFTVFLLTDGSVWTCGANYHGQLGKGVDADKDILQITPMSIDIGSFTAIAAKEQTWVTIGNNGVLYACGANTFGQFGLGDKKDRSVLTPIADNVERVQLTAGNIIIRKADGTVYGAGYNYDDRLNLNACKCITEFTKITEVE